IYRERAHRAAPGRPRTWGLSAPERLRILRDDRRARRARARRVAPRRLGLEPLAADRLVPLAAESRGGAEHPPALPGRLEGAGWARFTGAGRPRGSDVARALDDVRRGHR